MVTKRAIDQLPSLPQVLVQILDAIHSDSADYQHVAAIIRHDTAIAARLVAIANSSYFGRAKQCESIERALLFLGTDAVKTIVITASIKQFFSHFNQQHNQFLKNFWRRSLVSANFAQVLATLTSYSSPDEAYLCGLLLDVGQLMLLTSDEKQYLSVLSNTENDQQLLAAEQQQFSKTHCQLSGDLVDSWQISGFMADAVRYHHEPAKLVQDAHHLVKIINLASLLSAEGETSDNALATADALFGLNESLTRELRNRINNDVDALANSLGIDINDKEESSQNTHQSHRQLGERLGELGELAQVNAGLWQARSQDCLQTAMQRSLFLTFDITDSVLFLLDPDQNLLVSHSANSEPSSENDSQSNNTNNNEADFKVPLEAGRSLVSDALLQGQQQISSTASQPLNVIDRQLMRYCKADQLVCWPLKAQQSEQAAAVLVFAVNDQQLQDLQQRKNLAQTLCQQMANAISANNQRFENLNDQGPAAEQYQSKIREAVHEASNPLSIIRNYLEMLRIKLGDQHNANEGLELIKDEIDRVGNILLRLKDPDTANNDQNTLNINHIIESVGQIFKDSICATQQITLTLKLDPAMTEIPGNPEHLKQVLTNLLKNAVEALKPGGKITLSSEASVSFSGKNFATISVEDNGPGINDTIKKTLFSPVSSTKGEGHSGLGLSIVKKIIEDMDGSIVCRSNAESGTQFQVLLPQ